MTKVVPRSVRRDDEDGVFHRRPVFPIGSGFYSATKVARRFPAPVEMFQGRHLLKEGEPVVNRPQASARHTHVTWSTPNQHEHTRAMAPRGASSYRDGHESKAWPQIQPSLGHTAFLPHRGQMAADATPHHTKVATRPSPRSPLRNSLRPEHRTQQRLDGRCVSPTATA